MVIRSEPVPETPEEGSLTASSVTEVKRGRTRWWSPRNIGAIYLMVVLIALFSIWVPASFPHWSTAVDVMNQAALGGIVAIGLTIPLAAGMFDLSIGYTVGLSSIVAAWSLTSLHSGLLVAVLLALATGVAVGLLNGLICVGLGIDSFIGTLGSGSVIAGIILIVSKNQPIVVTQLGSLNTIAGTAFGNIGRPVFYMVVVGLVTWYLLEFTPFGRRLFATGMAPDAARLLGIRVSFIRSASLVASGLAASLAGIVLVGNVGEGSPTTGPEYLLPAFAAAFLGATQLRQSRFNVWGTLIAVYLLGTASEGLFFANTPPWTTSVFDGLALVLAVGLSGESGGRLATLISFATRKLRIRRSLEESGQVEV